MIAVLFQTALLSWNTRAIGALEEIILHEHTDCTRGSSALKNALQIPMAV
jgi:hypothetical protein